MNKEQDLNVYKVGKMNCSIHPNVIERMTKSVARIKVNGKFKENLFNG